MQAPIVIVGTGLGGYVLAKEIRRFDTETPLTMVTQSRGEFYHKPMLSTSLAKDVESLCTATADEMEASLNAKIYTETEVTALNLKERTLICKDQSIHYQACVLSVGAQPIRPNISGIDHPNISSVNNLEDYRHFRSTLKPQNRVAIVGGGLVGTEFANNLNQSGHAVTVISLAGPVSELLPQAFSACMQTQLESAGITWLAGNPVIEIKSDANELELILQTGQSIKADKILMAIGLASTTELARAAGLVCNHGIVVNELGQTSDEAVFSLGDCAELYGQVRRYVGPIRHMAAAMAQTLTGNPTPITFPAMPVVLKTPLCPTMIAPPALGVEGQWQITGEAPNLEATFVDNQGALRGFALMGDTMKLRGARLKDWIFE